MQQHCTDTTMQLLGNLCTAVFQLCIETAGYFYPGGPLTFF